MNFPWNFACVLGAAALMICLVECYIRYVQHRQSEHEAYVREAERLRRESMAAPRRIVDRDGRETYAGWMYHRHDQADPPSSSYVDPDGRLVGLTEP